MMKIDTLDVLQSIKQPEQHEILKSYELTQNILHDNQRLISDTKLWKPSSNSLGEHWKQWVLCSKNRILFFLRTIGNDK